jgi:hypothetical protein
VQGGDGDREAAVPGGGLRGHACLLAPDGQVRVVSLPQSCRLLNLLAAWPCSDVSCSVLQRPCLPQGRGSGGGFGLSCCHTSPPLPHCYPTRAPLCPTRAPALPRRCRAARRSCLVRLPRAPRPTCSRHARVLPLTKDGGGCRKHLDVLGALEHALRDLVAESHRQRLAAHKAVTRKVFQFAGWDLLVVCAAPRELSEGCGAAGAGVLRQRVRR